MIIGNRRACDWGLAVPTLHFFGVGCTIIDIVRNEMLVSINLIKDYVVEGLDDVGLDDCFQSATDIRGKRERYRKAERCQKYAGKNEGAHFLVTPGPKEGSGGRSKSDRQLDRQPAVVTSTNAYISKWLQHYKRILGFRNTILVSLLCFIRDSRSTCGLGALLP